MRNQAEKHDSREFAEKRKREAAWNDQVKRQQLSVAEINRAASMIPAGASIKVLGWPSL